MNALKTSVCVAALLVWPVAPVQASIHGSNITTPCPYGTCLADGYTGSPPNGFFQASSVTFAADSRQSGQTWATTDHPQTWSLACVEYKCGYDPALITKDPTTFNWTGTGCSYSAVNHKVTCLLNGKGNVVISGFDWSGGIASSGCTKLDILQTPTSLEISNNKFLRSGSGCDGDYLVKIESGTEPLLFTRNGVDGNYPTYPDTTDFVMQDNRSGGVGTYTYNVIRNNATKPFVGVFNGGLVYKYNYNDNFALYVNPNPALAAHAELVQGSADGGVTIPQFDWNYNVSVWPGAALGSGTSVVFATIGANVATPNFYQEITIDHNTMINNSNQAAGGTVTNSGATFFSRAPHIGTLTVTNNFVDPTGTLYCGYVDKYTSNIIGFVDDGAGNGVIAGRVLTANSQTNPIIPGATFFINGNESYNLVVAPYGTNGTTGTAAMVAGSTYWLSGTGPDQHLVLNSPGAGKGALTPVIDSFVNSNNISLRTNTNITFSGILLNAGVCGGNGRFP